MSSSVSLPFEEVWTPAILLFTCKYCRKRNHLSNGTINTSPLAGRNLAAVKMLRNHLLQSYLPLLKTQSKLDRKYLTGTVGQEALIFESQRFSSTQHEDR
ncbi:hypothetical protein BaRGS_00009285 [Batillaria attramentaria]|uniref:Uncharacterized protein n=1 Tax=Batillaria attramentaria TaxID=370345 RepID=A0ABD0LKE2_9CAEN